MQNTHQKFFQLNFILLLFGTLLTLIACGPSFNEDEPQPDLTDGSSSLQGYPSVGYPVGSGLDAYPVPPSTDFILNQPPAELPTFPGKIAFQTGAIWWRITGRNFRWGYWANSPAKPKFFPKALSLNGLQNVEKLFLR